MNSNIQKVIETIASDVIRLARSIIEESKLKENHSMKDGELYNNITSKIQETDNGIVIHTLFANYINYIEQGRAPKQGKQPPIDALRDWAIAKGIDPSNDTLWAISSAIWRDGQEARPILSILDTKTEEEFNSKWADELFEVVIADLTKSLFKFSKNILL